MTKPGEGSRSPSSRTRRYRIVAAEAHSWAALLLEDDRGRFHLHHVGTTATTAITPDAAKSLLESRTYRAWRGSQNWAVLEQLPVVSQLGGSQGSGEMPFVAGLSSDEAHSG
jgi:hypothetical protein